MTTPFAEYGRAGFGPSLLPVIPPGAPLSTHTKMRPDKLGKTPGKLLPSGFVGMRGWPDHIATEDDLANWDRWFARPHGCNIGLRGDEFPGLDLDVNDADLSARLARLALTRVGPAPTRRVLAPDTEAPGARCLLMYRGQNLASWTTRFEYAGAEHMVELKGGRRQCVIEGHHRSGGRYVWEPEKTLLRYGATGLTALTAAAADSLRAALEAEIEAAGGTIIEGRRTSAASTLPRAIRTGEARPPRASPTSSPR